MRNYSAKSSGGRAQGCLVFRSGGRVLTGCVLRRNKRCTVQCAGADDGDGDGGDDSDGDDGDDGDDVSDDDK